MIHTMDIYYPVDSSLLDDIIQCVGFNDDDLACLDEFIQVKNAKGTTKPIPVSKSAYKYIRRSFPGIKAIMLYRILDIKTSCFSYRVKLNIEPQEILEQRRTVNLFSCNLEDKERLSDIFYDMMSCIFGDIDNDLLDFSQWYASRVDYAINLNLLNHRNVETFIRLTKYTTQGARYDVKTNSLEDDTQSTAQANKSTKLHLYDKERELDGIDAKIELTAAAAGIVRLEVQCKSSKIKSMCRSQIKERPHDRHALEYMNPKLAVYNIWNYYSTLVGFGDFYHLQKATRKIENYDYKPKMKINLINYIRLASQVKTRQELKIAALNGRRLKHYGNQYLHFSNSTCYQYKNKLLHDLNIHVMPIRNSLYKKILTRYFINPLKPINFKTEDINLDDLPIVPSERYNSIKYLK